MGERIGTGGGAQNEGQSGGAQGAEPTDTKTSRGGHWCHGRSRRLIHHVQSLPLPATWVLKSWAGFPPCRLPHAFPLIVVHPAVKSKTKGGVVRDCGWFFLSLWKNLRYSRGRTNRIRSRREQAGRGFVAGWFSRTAMLPFRLRKPGGFGNSGIFWCFGKVIRLRGRWKNARVS